MDFQNRYRDTLGRGGEFGSSGALRESRESEKIRNRESERELEKMARSELGQELTGLEQELMEFRSCVESIGTNLDNSENRDNARRLRILIKKRIRDASGKLKLRHKGSPQQSIEAQQLSKKLASFIQQFEDILSQEKQVTRQRSITNQSSVSTDGVDSPMMMHMQATAETAILDREKDANDLMELERDILDLHDMQRDLTGIVVDQGEVVNNIEANVSKAAVRVERGKNRLDTAVTIKRKNRRLKVCIFLAVAIPIAIILLIAIIIMIIFIPRINNN